MEDIKIFRGSGLNKDDDLDLIQGGDSRNRDNVGFIDGNYDILVPRKVPENLAKSLPSSNNPTIIGTCPDKENDAIIYFYTDDSNNHSIYRVFADESLDTLSNSESFWDFSTDYPITHAFIIGDGDEATLVWTDNYNPIRAVLITTLTDGDTLTIANTCLHKPSPLDKITVSIETDTNYLGNNIVGKFFQFACKYVYTNNQKSTFGRFSDVLFDYSNEYCHSPIREDSSLANYLELTIPVDSVSVDKIELFFRNIDIGSGAQGYWYYFATIDASTPSVTHDFYNDATGYVIDPDDAIKLFDDIPDKAKAVELISNNRIILAGFTKGKDSITPDVTLSAVNKIISVTSHYYGNVQDNASVANAATGTLTASMIGITDANVAWQVIVIYDDATDDFETFDLNTYKNVATANDIADYFRDLITDSAVGLITAGGTGADIEITNGTGGGITIGLVYYEIGDAVKYQTMKEGRHVFAIRYYDDFNKNGAAITTDSFSVNVPYFEFSTFGVADTQIDAIKYVIGHTAPSWAKYWQFLYGGSDIYQHFSIAVRKHHVTFIGKNAVIDIVSALSYFNKINNIETYDNYFTPQKGDYMKVRSMIYSSSIRTAEVILDSKKCDLLEVLGVDDDGNVLASGSSIYDILNIANAYTTYIFEFIRYSQISDSDRIFREVGEVLSISNGYHETSGNDTYTGITAVVQQSGSVDGVGTIDFGDCYVVKSIANITKVGATGNNVFGFFNRSQSMSIFYDSKFNNTGRYGLVDDEESTKFYNAMMWSGLWRDDDLSFSEFNKFEDSNIKYLNDKHGPICALKEMGYTLYVFQRSKLTPIEIGRQTVEQDGQTMVVSTSVVLGSARPFNEDFGTIYPGSITVFDGGLIFYDPLTMGVYWLRQDGLQNIAKIKMVSFFKDLSNTIQTEGTDNYHCWSFYDIRTESYVLAVIDETTPANNFSLSFHVPSQKWMCTENYKYEGMVSFGGNKVVSFDSGEIYMHHEDSQTHELGYLDIHFNPVPTKHVLFRGVDVLSTYLWSSSDNPSIWVDEDEAEYEETDTYLTYNGAQQSLIPDGRWEKINGRWKASYLRNKLYRDGTDGGDIRLYQGDRLAGRHLTQRLTNTEATETNKLKSALLKYTTKS